MSDYSLNNWSQQNGAFSPVDPAFQWDFTGVQSPKTMANHYNDVSSPTLSLSSESGADMALIASTKSSRLLRYTRHFLR